MSAGLRLNVRVQAFVLVLALGLVLASARVRVLYSVLADGHTLLLHKYARDEFDAIEIGVARDL